MDYIGIDLHKATSQMCIVNEQGEITERRIRTGRDSFSELLGSRPSARILVLSPRQDPMRFAVTLGLVLTVTAAVYGWNLDHEFQYDDVAKIVEQQSFRDPASFLSAFGTGLHSEAASRFFPNLTLSLNYALSGYEPFGYHLTDLLFHLVNVVLVALFARALLRRAGAPDDSVAIFGAALFAVHPLNTEAVNYCNARPNVMVTTFYLAALLALLYAEAATAGEGRRRLAWATFGASTLLALLCKEMAVSLAVAAPLLLWWFPSAEQAAERARRKLMLAGGTLVTASVAIGVATGGVFGARDAVMRTGAAATGHWLTYTVVTLLDQSQVFLHYLGLAVVPAPTFLNVDHNGMLHLHHRLFDHGHAVDGALGTTVLPLASFGLLLAFVRGLFAWRRHARAPTFLALWPFVTHAPTSLVPRTEAMVEYRTYLPMVGVCLGLSWALFALVRWCAGARHEASGARAGPRCGPRVRRYCSFSLRGRSYGTASGRRERHSGRTPLARNPRMRGRTTTWEPPWPRSGATTRR